MGVLRPWVCRRNAEPARQQTYGVQVAAIIFTLSTFNVGAADALELLADPLALDDDELLGCTVPEISTLWPTCGVSLLASASSL